MLLRLSQSWNGGCTLSTFFRIKFAYLAHKIYQPSVKNRRTAGSHRNTVVAKIRINLYQKLLIDPKKVIWLDIFLFLKQWQINFPAIFVFTLILVLNLAFESRLESCDDLELVEEFQVEGDYEVLCLF